jgi:hypothetical protein
MGTIKKVLTYTSMLLFTLTGVLAYAYVLDIEPLPLDKEYIVERDYFNRTNNNPARSFPDFEHWVVECDERKGRFYDWVDRVLDRIGKDAAETFDPWHQDTREGHAGQAPDNWAKGERD